MTTPCPTVREIISDLRDWSFEDESKSRRDTLRFAADALLGSNLPLDAPYYPEPQKFLFPHPQSAVGDYTWNHQKGDWEVKEIDGVKDPEGAAHEQMLASITATGETVQERLLEAHRGIAKLFSQSEDYISRPAFAAGVALEMILLGSYRSAPSSLPASVNAGTALQDGAVMEPAYICSENHFSGARVILGFNALREAQDAHERLAHQARKARDERRVRNTGDRDRGGDFPPEDDLPAVATEPPPTPTPASTAGAVEELAACPFCGSESEIDQFNPEAETEWRRLCRNKKCQAWGPERRSEAEAITAWNRRASPASATITRLKEIIPKLVGYAAHDQDCDSRNCTCGYTVTVRAAQALADLAGEG